MFFQTFKVEPGNAVKNYSKKQKQTTATVLQPNNNTTMTTNATNMVGQILMTPTNVTQIDLGKIGMHAYKMDVSYPIFYLRVLRKISYENLFDSLFVFPSLIVVSTPFARRESYGH